MNTIEELTSVMGRLLSQVAELTDEHNFVTAAAEDPDKMRKVIELAERVRAQQCTSNDGSAAEPAHTSTLMQQPKLISLFSFTGLNVKHVAMKALPVEDGMPWFHYDVLAQVKKLRFVLSIIWNQTIGYQYSETDVCSHNFKKLGIQMTDGAHQLELAEMLHFYAMNPTLFGRAVQNLTQYNDLCLHRNNSIKKLQVKYEEDLVATLDHFTGFYKLKFRGCLCKRNVFTLIWSVVWNVSEMALRDSFKWKMVESDTQFLTDLDPVLRILIDPIEHFSEKRKLSLIENIMLAVKDADIRLFYNN